MLRAALCLPSNVSNLPKSLDGAHNTMLRIRVVNCLDKRPQLAWL